MKKILLVLIYCSSIVEVNSQTTCVSGFAGIYPCDKIDLLKNMPFNQIGGSLSTEGNDCWGWTDPLTGKEYALMGCTSHTAFIDISNPVAPVYLGKLNSRNNISSLWRDIKVYNNYAFIVSEASGHGIQVFDLTRLRAANLPATLPTNFTANALYSGFGNCHNIAINEATGFAYCIGSNTYGGGIHAVNIQNPLNPVFSFGYNDQGYCHDAQIVIYNGPDTEHVGKEIFFGANEDKVVAIDVTNKLNPILLSTYTYPNTAYTHQGWLTTDQKYWILGDEVDETSYGFNTRTIVVDFSNLDAPTTKSIYNGTTAAIDHNGYTKNNEFYLANYRAGLRLISTSTLDATGVMNEVAFFDTYPTSNNAQYNGAWSVYPYFPSGNIIVSDIDRGLFVLRKNASLNNSIFENQKIVFSPNPAKDNVTINFAGTIETIDIYNILGKKIKSFSSLNNSSFNLETSDLISGLYIVIVNNAVTQKLVVE